MKKLTFIGLFALLCASCIAKPEAPQSPQPQQPEAVAVPSAPADIDMTQVYTYTPEQAATQQFSDDDFYRRNIVVKATGDNYVIYEYTNVRIDQVAMLASQYCYEIDPCLSAYLRDMYMNKNHRRRVTFECIDLARF